MPPAMPPHFEDIGGQIRTRKDGYGIKGMAWNGVDIEL
jgi:hypothetical protein